MIYQSAFRKATILYLQMISLHTCTDSCTWLLNPLSMQNNMHHPMISTILQYGKEMADIIANNIFHKKATVNAYQSSRPKSS